VVESQINKLKHNNNVVEYWTPKNTTTKEGL